LSGSHGDLNRLFNTILSNATKLCQANFGALFLCETDALRLVAQHNAPPAYAELRQREPLARGRHLLLAVETKQLVHVPDVREYVTSNPADKDAAAFAKLSGVRTVVIMPMLKGDEVVGEIVIYRQEVRAFNDREIGLLKSFAVQAVIAIENARLLNELRHRTDDLSEALEQQTATSDVLKVIANTQGELEPVFNAILENATRICEAELGTLVICENDGFRHVAGRGLPPDYVELRKREPVLRPPNNAPLRRLAANKQVIHVVDLLNEPARGQLATLAGSRTQVLVPLLKDDRLIGAMVVFRKEVRPFTDKQIDLLKNFAAQAVIAIENARLLNELRQRTTDLTEALEQQTASAEVLQAISSSAGDLEPIFAIMLRKAVSICDAKFGTLYFRESDRLRLIVTHGVPPAFAEAQGKAPFHPVSDGMLDAVMRTGRTVHLTDLAHARSYIERDPRMVEAVEIGGIRSVVGVPLTKDDELIGIIGIYRQEFVPSLPSRSRW
jgi:GAF domain-containing protein